MAIAKDFKQSEVGVIPADWNLVEIDQLSTSVASGRSKQDSHYGDFPLYGSTGIIGTVTKGEYSGEAILVARVGANAGQLNPVSGTYGVTDNTIIVKINSSIPLEYVWRQLEAKKLNRMVFGSGQPLITGTQIKAIKIPVPTTRGEQEAITNALNDADTLIESLEKLIAKKRLIKKGAMQELLTGKRRLPGFNEKWQEKSIGDLFYVSGGLSASRDQLSNEGHLYLHYGDIHTSRKTHIDVQLEQLSIPRLNVPLAMVNPASLLSDGDIVFVDASEDDDGTSKHVVIVNPNNVPFISGLHTIVAKPKTKILDRMYCRHCFKTADVKRQFKFYAVGTKVSGVSKSNIIKISIQVPSVDEQRSIAEILNDMDSEISAFESQLNKARLIKLGMMQELLTGRIRLI